MTNPFGHGPGFGQSPLGRSSSLGELLRGEAEASVLSDYVHTSPENPEPHRDATLYRQDSQGQHWPVGKVHIPK